MPLMHRLGEPSGGDRRILERLVQDRFGVERWTVRWYVAVRRLLAPFEAVARAVPSGGVVLDIGCGVGYFAMLLGVADAARRVIGMDWDRRRIETARRVAENLANVSFEVADAADAAWWRRFSAQSVRAVVCLDLLYLLPHDQQYALFAEAERVLEPNGVLVIKRASRFPSWKRRWHRWQEYLAVRVLQFTKGRGLWFEEGGDPLSHPVGWEHQTFDLSRGYVYPHELVVLRKPRLDQQRAGMFPETTVITTAIVS